MQEVGATKWSLVADVLASHGLRMLSCSSTSKVHEEEILAFLRIAGFYHLI